MDLTVDLQSDCQDNELEEKYEIEMKTIETLTGSAAPEQTGAEATVQTGVRIRLWTVLYCVVTTCVMSLLVGATLSYSSPVLLELTQLRDPQFRFNIRLSDIFGAVPLVGAIFGGPIGGWIADRWGRKTSLVLNSFPYLCGYFILLSSYLASNGVLFKVLLMAGRFLTGVGMGWAYVAVPVYIGEISPAGLRGIFGVFSELFLTIGLLLVYGLGSIPAFPYYKLTLVIVAVITAYIFMVIWIPETPRWLLLKFKDKHQAIAILKCLRGPKYQQIDKEFDAIKASILDTKRSFRDSLQLWRNKNVLCPFLILLFLYIFQQLCGAGSTVSAYAGLLFKDAGVSNPDVTATYAWGGASILGVVIASFLVEVSGRKVLLTVSATGMLICCTVLGVHFYITRPSLCNNSTLLINSTDFPSMEEAVSCNSHLSPLAIVSFLFYGIAFSLGLGAIPWVLLSEYLPLQVRGTAGGIVVAANWSAAAALTGSFLSYSEFVGAWFAWWSLALINLIGLLVIVIFVLETKGKTLEEVQELFKSRTTLCYKIKR